MVLSRRLHSHEPTIITRRKISSGHIPQSVITLSPEPESWWRIRSSHVLFSGWSTITKYPESATERSKYPQFAANSRKGA